VALFSSPRYWLCVGRIGAPRPRTGGQAALPDYNLVGTRRCCPVVSQGGGVSPFVGCIGCILEGVVTFCSHFLFFICFVRGFPHYFVLVWPCAALFIKQDESLFRERFHLLFRTIPYKVNVRWILFWTMSLPQHQYICIERLMKWRLSLEVLLYGAKKFIPKFWLCYRNWCVKTGDHRFLWSYFFERNNLYLDSINIIYCQKKKQ
jgi:hypothetical protein